MTNRTPTGILILVLAAGLAGCDGAGSRSLTAPSTVVTRLCMLPVLGLIRGAEELTERHEAKYFAQVPKHELRIDLVRALESLPDMYREVILLRDMEAAHHRRGGRLLAHHSRSMQEPYSSRPSSSTRVPARR